MKHCMTEGYSYTVKEMERTELYNADERHILDYCRNVRSLEMMKMRKAFQGENDDERQVSHEH